MNKKDDSQPIKWTPRRSYYSSFMDENNSEWTSESAKLQDHYKDFFEQEFQDNLIPESLEAFWDTVEENLVFAIADAIDEIKLDFSKEMRNLFDQNRNFIRYSIAKPGSLLWSFEDLVDYFKLPENVVCALIEDPSFPPSMSIVIRNNDETPFVRRWFSKDIIEYTRNNLDGIIDNITIDDTQKSCSNTCINCGKCNKTKNNPD